MTLARGNHRLPSTDESWPYPDAEDEMAAEDEVDLDVLELRVDPRAYFGLEADEREVLFLRFDRQRRDRFGRLLAYVEVDSRRFNDELLAGGYAKLLVIPPNGRHGRAMLDRELAARSAGRGLWGACSRPDGG